MNFDSISAKFDYTPAFIKVIIPGTAFVVFVIIMPFIIYYHFNNPILLTKISSGNRLLLSLWLLPIIIASGLLINTMSKTILQFLEGYTLNKFLPEKFVQKMKKYQYNKFLKMIRKRNGLSNEFEYSIEKDRLYESMHNYYSICLYYVYYHDFNKKTIVHYLMPTSLGNIFRSIEIYSDWKYGVDSVFFWPRLMSIISEQDRNDLNYKYAFVNMYAYLSLIFGLSFVVFEILSIILLGKMSSIIFSMIALIIYFLSVSWYKMLLVSTINYGESVKSMFDLYKRPLLDKFDLGSMNIDPNADEKEIWKQIKEYLYYPKPSSD